MAHRSVIASLFGLALVAGACSSPLGEVDRSTVDTQVTSTTVPDGLAFVDEADPDATLHLALTRPANWTPAQLSLTDQNAVVLADLLYDGLTEASGATLAPALAASWTANSDFTRWTFALDTDRVSPADVVSSFDRLIVEAADSAAVALLGDVEEISASGDNAVRFTLRNPNAGFAWLLSGVQYSITVPGPTGRYAIVEDSAEQMVLASSKFADITISWHPDGKATYQQLTLGQAEAAVVDPTVSRDAANRFGQRPSARSIVRFYGLNLASEDLWDPRVREAALISIDRPAVLEELPTAGFTADGVAGASTAGFRYGACNMACIYHPDDARSLLRDAGGAPTLTIVYVGEDQVGVASEISRSLQKGGFRTEVTQVSAEELPIMIADGSAEIFAFGWAAPAGSMDAVVPALFASGSPLNVTRLVSEEVDDLLDLAALTADDNERWELLSQAHEAALAQWVAIPVAVAHNGLVQSPDIDHLSVRPDGSLDASSIK